MSIVNIICYVVLGIAAIFGLIKGFSKKKLGSFLFTVSGLVGYMGGVPLARLLMDTRLGYDFLQNGYHKLLPETTPYTNLLTGDADNKTALIKEGLTALKFPSFFQGMFTSRVLDTTSDVGTALASSFANLTMIGICVFVIFLLCYLILHAILGKVWDTIFGEKGKNFVGRICGMVNGLAKGVITVLAVMAVVALIDQLLVKYNQMTLHNWLISDLKLDDTQDFSLGKFLYNTASSLLTWISNR